MPREWLSFRNQETRGRQRRAGTGDADIYVPYGEGKLAKGDGAYCVAVVKAELFPAEKRGTALHRIVSTLSYSVGTTLMTGTFDGTRFVAPPNYHSSNPFLGYRSFTIDLTALISTNK